jgi:hypothetical protein
MLRVEKVPRVVLVFDGDADAYSFTFAERPRPAASTGLNRYPFPPFGRWVCWVLRDGEWSRSNEVTV